jgi:hypothetical protein
MNHETQPTVFSGFDEYNHKDYFLESYIQGSEVCTTKGLNYDNFDQVIFFRASKSQLTKIEYVHAIGSRNADKQNVMLILKKRKQ